MEYTRIDLTPGVRKGAIALLQASLYDAVDLFTQAKQAHWNVKGPTFIALHELFDRVATAVAERGDVLAERITALGGRADGTARTTAGASTVPEFPANLTTERQFVEAVADRLAGFGRTTRAAIDRASALGDADTADVFTEVSRDTDKLLWLVEAHLQPAA